MAAKLCKYCNVQMLEGFDEIERKFFEQGTRTHHTRERCEALKNKGGSSGLGTANGHEFKQINEKLDQIIAMLKGQGTLEGSD